MVEVPPNLHFLELVQWVKTRGNVEEFERFFVISQDLWGRHNKKRGKNETPASAIGRATSYCSLFVGASAVPTRELRHLSHWQSPPQGFFKLNVDGVLFLDFKAVEFVAVLRDSSSEVLLAATILDLSKLEPVLILLSIQTYSTTVIDVFYITNISTHLVSCE